MGCLDDATISNVFIFACVGDGLAISLGYKKKDQLRVLKLSFAILAMRLTSATIERNKDWTSKGWESTGADHT